MAANDRTMIKAGSVSSVEECGDNVMAGQYGIGTMNVESKTKEQMSTKSKFLSGILKQTEISSKWMVFHWISLIIAIILVIICLTIPLTGAILVYSAFLFLVSIDTLITTLICNNGICCISNKKRMNKMDDIFTIFTTFIWLTTFFICIICGFSDTTSPNTYYSRWEELVPTFVALFLEIILIQKIYIRLNKLPIYNTTNFNEYHQQILSSSKSCGFYVLPLRWLLLLFMTILALFGVIHSAQKSIFINSFQDRDSNILTTASYGDFEYICSGNDPRDADIRVISIGGLSSVITAFGWFNALLWNEYGIEQGKNIAVCSYSRGGFGFTPTKLYRNKLIKPEVDHLFAIADQLFGTDKSIHLLGHSRANMILLQAKMINNERVESIVIFDGVPFNTNTIVLKRGVVDTKFVPNNWFYTSVSAASPFLPVSMVQPIILEQAGGEDPNIELTASYYSFRNYLYQSIAWESKDYQQSYVNTAEMYRSLMRTNFTFQASLSYNIECEEWYDEIIRYSQLNNTLYVKTAHAPCVYNQTIANMIWNYNNTGLKSFYDSLFL